ncbi:MAG: dihydrodipicolinate reductase [Bacteroidia bacterium]|nr:dihydrodipicolinate reductase [Bacteroidia bacterium]
MKIGLIGFGKTGKAVASVILQNKEYSLEWVLRKSIKLENRNVSEFLGIQSDETGLIYSSSKIEINELLDKHPVDVIIDFSSNTGIYLYGKPASDRKIKIISAISHYGENEKKLLKELSTNTVVFWSPNITLGVNYLIFAAKLLKKLAPNVDIEVIEQHYKGKDGVSGTATKIAKALDLGDSEINSIRVGGIVGKHEIVFGFPHQTVRLIHESISREAFGNGVLFVVENLVNKSEGLYKFEEILMQHFKE